MAKIHHGEFMMDFGHYLAKNHARKKSHQTKILARTRWAILASFWFDGNFPSMIFG